RVAHHAHLRTPHLVSPRLLRTLCLPPPLPPLPPSFFFLNDPPPPDTYTLSLHDALPISRCFSALQLVHACHYELIVRMRLSRHRSEEHTSELQSLTNLVCRLLLEKKKKRGLKSGGGPARVGHRWDGHVYDSSHGEISGLA